MTLPEVYAAANTALWLLMAAVGFKRRRADGANWTMLTCGLLGLLALSAR